MEKRLRNDMNLMKNPTWIVRERNAKNPDGFEWGKIDGYLMKTLYNPPSRKDQVIFVYLLLLSQESGYQNVVKTPIFEMLKNCQLSTDGKEYDRLKESLKRWQNLNVNFKGTFYDGEKYKTLNFSFINSWGINEDDLLEVEFSKQLILIIKNSTFVNYINFQNMLKLKSPLSLRLYEILINHLTRKQKWVIGNKKLSAKLTIQSGYPAHLIPKVRKSLKEINHNTDLHVALNVQRERGVAKFHFRRQRKPNPKKPERTVNGTGLIDVVKYQRDRTEMVESLLLEYSKKFNYNYVKQNTEYTNRRARGNYYGYLVLALENNYAKAAIPRKEEKRQVPPPKKCKCGGDVKPWEMRNRGADQLVEWKTAMCIACKQVYVNTEEGWVEE
jgi:plasmid replication initiation protein